MSKLKNWNKPCIPTPLAVFQQLADSINYGILTDEILTFGEEEYMQNEEQLAFIGTLTEDEKTRFDEMVKNGEEKLGKNPTEATEAAIFAIENERELAGKNVEVESEEDKAERENFGKEV